MIQVSPLLPWLKQTYPEVADTALANTVAVAAEVAEAAPDRAWGAVVGAERNQAEQTNAIDAAVDSISTQNALMMLTVVKKKRILRVPIPR